MTATADRAVDYHESRLQLQKLQDFPDEHRTVHGRARIVAGRRRIGHWLYAKAFELCCERALRDGK
jgi:hypothetical protein